MQHYVHILADLTTTLIDMWAGNNTLSMVNLSK